MSYSSAWSVLNSAKAAIMYQTTWPWQILDSLGYNTGADISEALVIDSGDY